MRDGWDTKTLGDVLQKTESVDPRSLPDAEFEYVDVSSVSNVSLKIKTTQLLKGVDAPSRARKRIRANDVIFATVRPTLRRIAIVPEWLDKQVCSTGYFVLRPKDGIDPSFVFYYLQTSGFMDRMEALQTGASYPAVTDGQIKGESIPVPPLDEQQRIVRILDEALDAIASAKTNAERNLANAKALFDSERDSIFSSKGEGWITTSVDQISTNLDRKRVPITKSDRTSGEYPYYGASGIVDYVSDYIFDGEALLVSEDGANLIARATPIAFSVAGRYWVNNHAHILQFDEMATQRMVEHYLESISLHDFITGTAQPKLNQSALNRIPVVIPKSLGDQVAVLDRLDSLQEKVLQLESIYTRKLTALDELKRSLLYQAFAGEL